MSIKTVLKEIGDNLYQNSPKLLSGFACAGVISTAFFASRATLKLKEDGVTLARFKNCETKREKKSIVKKVTKVYGPTIASGVVTIGCIIASNRISNKRLAVVAGLYSMSKEALSTYQQKTVEVVGEKQAQKIRESIAADKVAKNPPTIDGKTVIFGGGMGGKILCLDSQSGRYFESDYETIRSVVNTLNHRLLSEHWIDLNEFYNELGLEETKQGNDMGWMLDHESVSGQIEIDYDTVLSQEYKVPVLLVNYDVVPKGNFPYF